MGHVIRTYEYPDASGWGVRRKHRWEPKSFTWECQTDSGWNPGYGSEPDILYRLPEVLAAVRAGETIAVTEGEKDADSWVEAGWGPATTPPQNGEWPEGLAAPLAGADVMLIWDRDEPGIQRGRWARNALLAVGAHVTCWRTAVGNDVTDHILAGQSVEYLVAENPPKPEPDANGNGYAEAEAVAAVLADAGEYREDIERVLATFQGGEPDIQVLTRADILNQPPPRWLVDGWIPEVGYTVLYGAQGVGKTILVSDLCDIVNRGWDWHGYPVAKGAAFMLEGEGTLQLGQVWNTLVRQRGDFNGAAETYYTQATWDITTLSGLARLALLVKQHTSVRLLVVDSAGLYGTVNRDGVEDTRDLSLAMRSLALGLNVTVIILQHTNAAGEARGTKHLQMFSEAVLKMETMGSREAGLLHDLKNRYGPLKAMRLEKVDMSPGMVWDPSRGRAGDEYVPDDFAREKAARREEAKAEAQERRSVSASEDPDNRAAVWDAIPIGESRAASFTTIRPQIVGLANSSRRTVFDSMYADGMFGGKLVGASMRYWRTK